MEKNLTLSANSLYEAGVANTVLNLVAHLVAVLLMPVEALRRYYSHVLERRLNMRQTWLLINAQTAFLFAAFASGGPLVARLLFCAWFIHAVVCCRRSLQTA